MRDQFNFSGDFRGAAIGINGPAPAAEAVATDAVKPRKLRVSPYYLNTRRLSVLSQVDIPVIAQESVARNSAERSAAMEYARTVADRLLEMDRFPSLNRNLLEAVDDCGTIAQIWDVMAFAGSGAAVEADVIGKSRPAHLAGTITLDGRAYEISGELLTDHFYSGSSAGNLRGRKRLLVAGNFQFRQGKIEVSPYIIGDLADVTGMDAGSFGFSTSWQQKVRVFPEQIAAFSKIQDVERGTAAEVKVLGEVPEEDVKSAFAQLIGEPFIPIDWGGEKSDLQTNHLVVDEEACAAAFAFKGPGLRGEMHPNQLGKRGDQLIRLFDEPVELVVLQHHNKIANTVVREAESLASNPRHPRRYCILDGADTVRILKAYGLFPPPSAHSRLKRGT